MHVQGGPKVLNETDADLSELDCLEEKITRGKIESHQISLSVSIIIYIPQFSRCIIDSNFLIHRFQMKNSRRAGETFFTCKRFGKITSTFRSMISATRMAVDSIPRALHIRREITKASFSRDKMYTSETALRRSYRVTCERAQRREMKFGSRGNRENPGSPSRAEVKPGSGELPKNLLPTVIHVVIVGYTRGPGGDPSLFSLLFEAILSPPSRSNFCAPLRPGPGASYRFYRFAQIRRTRIHGDGVLRRNYDNWAAAWNRGVSRREIQFRRTCPPRMAYNYFARD